MKDYYQDREWDMAETKPFQAVKEKDIQAYNEEEIGREREEVKPEAAKEVKASQPIDPARVYREPKSEESRKAQSPAQTYRENIDATEKLDAEELENEVEDLEDEAEADEEYDEEADRVEVSREEAIEGYESLESPAKAPQEKMGEGSFFVGLRDWILPLVVALALALIIRMFIGGPTSVKGQSMETTLHSGDILLVSKIPTYSRKFNRADIIIMDSPSDPGELYVKRIVGLPGEMVEIQNGHVFINNKLLKEYYIRDLPTGTYRDTVWQLQEDEYFVMGDNREEGASSDSRLFGPVKADKIEAVARFRIFPLSKITSFY